MKEINSRCFAGSLGGVYSAVPWVIAGGPHLVTLLDRSFFPYYNNTQIIQFGWELFILWIISYGQSHFRDLPDFQSKVPTVGGGGGGDTMTTF